MIDLETPMIVALAISGVALVGTLWNCIMLKRWRNIYKVSATDGKLPPDQDLIAQWQTTMASLPEHSPKWQAYKKRLIAIGALSGD